MVDDSIRIRRADRQEDIRACVTLQKEVWGFVEPEDMVAPPLLILGNRYGGCVLVAETTDGKIAGFSYAFLAKSPGSDGALFWWSHMTAVSPALRGRSIGFRLKLAQRSAALESGIRVIRWTFDPLQALNAHFNIRKLGTFCRIYEENIYGTSSSPLHHGLPTDRLLVEWHVDTTRVRDRLSGEAPVILRDFDGLVRIHPGCGSRPDPPTLGRDDSPLVLEIPPDLVGVLGEGPDAVRAWQGVVREAFLHYFGRGYAVTDFVRLDKPRPQALYVLERPSAP